MKKNRTAHHPLHPLIMREDTPQPMNISPSHQCTLPLVTAQMAKNSAASLTWYLQQKGCHQSLTTWMTQGMKNRPLLPADVNADQDNFEDKDRQKNLAKTLKRSSTRLPGKRKLPMDHLRTWKRSPRLSSQFMMDSGMTETRTSSTG